MVFGWETPRTLNTRLCLCQGYIVYDWIAPFPTNNCHLQNSLTPLDTTASGPGNNYDNIVNNYFRSSFSLSFFLRSLLFTPFGNNQEADFFMCPHIFTQLEWICNKINNFSYWIFFLLKLILGCFSVFFLRTVLVGVAWNNSSPWSIYILNNLKHTNESINLRELNFLRWTQIS